MQEEKERLRGRGMDDRAETDKKADEEEWLEEENKENKEK